MIIHDILGGGGFTRGGGGGDLNSSFGMNSAWEGPSKKYASKVREIMGSTVNLSPIGK